jgi:ABC-type multidrug transport system, ATPase and permease components
LIFDEATSSLDSDSELKVQNAIERVLKNKSAFIVAHRLSTIKNADKIIVMHEKGIESIGSHDDLMISSKTYQKLYRTQFDINE